MNILITGGAGFIGSHTVDALVKKRHHVRILDALTRPVHPRKTWPAYLPKNVEKICGDVRRKRDWIQSLKNIDAIYHFAAYQDYQSDFSTYFDVNCRGTALLYEIIVAMKLPIKRIILASSQAVYGEGRYQCPRHGIIFPQQRSSQQLKKHQWDICPSSVILRQSRRIPLKPRWVREDDPPRPHNPYAMSKRTQEEIALNLGARYTIPTIAFRYSIVQGSRQSPHNPYSGALRQFVTALLQKRRPTIYEDGRQRRDFVNIHDVVDANIMALRDKRMIGEVYNVGGGKAITVNTLYSKVQHILRLAVTPIRDGSYRPGDTRHIFSSITKLKKLGWSPKRTVDDSIKEYIEWITGISGTIPSDARKQRSALPNPSTVIPA